MEVPSKLMGAQLVPCLRFRLLLFYRSTSCCSVACAGEAQPGRCRWGGDIFGSFAPTQDAIVKSRFWWIQLTAVTFDCHHHLRCCSTKTGSNRHNIELWCKSEENILRMKWHGSSFVGFQWYSWNCGYLYLRIILSNAIWHLFQTFATRWPISSFSTEWTSEGGKEIHLESNCFLFLIFLNNLNRITLLCGRFLENATIIWETSANFFQGSRDASSTVEWRYKGGPNFLCLCRHGCMIFLCYTEQKMFCIPFRWSARKNAINDRRYMFDTLCVYILCSISMLYMYIYSCICTLAQVLGFN